LSALSQWLQVLIEESTAAEAGAQQHRIQVRCPVIEQW